MNSSRIARYATENRIKETFLDPNGSKEKKQENPSTDNSENEYSLNNFN